jgi:hypothetical protein
MISDYNHEAAKAFVEALRDGDTEAALLHGTAVTHDPDAVNYGVSPDKEYNGEELANLIEANLRGIDQGRWDMTEKVYLPIVIGAICNWVTEELNREDDGKTGSESLEQSTTADPSGS